MGIFYSSIECPEGKCYRRIPMMAMAKIERDPEAKKTAMAMLGDRKIAGIERVTEEDVLNLMRCLDIPITDGSVTKSDQEAHEHKIQESVCCDADFLNEALRGEWDETKKSLMKIQKVDENGELLGYRLCTEC